MALTTGQITIVDNNDARSITAALAASTGTQQIYNKDESTITYDPSWFTTALVITPQISIGGLTSAEAWGALKNKTFSLTTSTDPALTTSTTSTQFVNDADVVVNTPFTVTHATEGTSTPSTCSIKGNLKIGTFTLFFIADFVDPNTSLTTRFTCQITLQTLKTGTNAVFITIRGKTSIEEATGSVKNNIAVAADLVRAGGVIDVTGLTYKWYDTNGTAQITTSTTNYGSKYGFKTTAASSGAPTAAAGTSELNKNVPDASGNAHNTIVISEKAVADIGIFRVDITDSDSKTYSAYFTVYDISDPYDLQIISSTGDKLQNGQGSTTLYPRVFYGASEVTNLTGWIFNWYFFDKDGKQGAFIDKSKIANNKGAEITANTIGNSATFSYSSKDTSYQFAAGQVLKVVKPNGAAYFYEAARAPATNQVEIRPATTANSSSDWPNGNSGWLTATNFPYPVTANEFVGGRIYGCVTPVPRQTSGATSFTVTGDEVDVKARILCEGDKPV